MPQNMLYLNGKVLPLEEGRVSVEDRGFQLGDGVYESVKVLNRRLLWWEEHVARLDFSLAALRMPSALAGHDLGSVAPRLVELAGLDTGVLYLQVTRGAGPRDFCFSAEPHPTILAYTRTHVFPAEREIRAGIALHPVEDIRWGRCDIKTTNLLPAVLAKQEACEVGCQEALWIGPRGECREGGSSNFFAVLRGVLRTHPADNRILNGITRQTALRLARELGVPVEERPVTLEELAAGEEAFIASTTNEVMPAVRVGSSTIATGRPGPITLGLADAVRAEAARMAGLPRPQPLVKEA